MKDMNAGDEECVNVAVELLLSNLIMYKPLHMLVF